MRALGQAPHVTVLRASGLEGQIAAAGFAVGAVEIHASNGSMIRPFIVARRR